MPEGTHKIILTRPRQGVQDDRGQLVIPEPSASDIFTVYARRQDRGGRETIYADTRSGNWSTRFEIRRTPKLDRLNSDWDLADTFGRDYDIEAVDEVGNRRTHFWIYAIRRDIR